MRIAFFDTHPFEKKRFEESNREFQHQISYFEPRLNRETAILAAWHIAVCSFANDRVDAKTIDILKQNGVRLIALRSAGFNHVDVVRAKEVGIKVVRVPAYSPASVAEHATALILSLNRKIYRAHNRVREGNFSLDGLVGFDLKGKTVGIIGTGRIGSRFAAIMAGFGCELLAFDLKEDPSLIQRYGVRYTSLEELYAKSHIISLHIPLNEKTRHLVDAKALSQMKKGVMLINTGRGGLIDTAALIAALKKEWVGFAGLDVYEEEEGVFFEDLSNQILKDDLLARLLTFPNVLITAHQGFLTEEALKNIADTTLQNISEFEKGMDLANEVKI